MTADQTIQASLAADSYRILVSIKQAAAMLGVDWEFADRMVELGLLEVVHTKGSRRYVSLPVPISRQMLYEIYVAKLPDFLDLDALDHLRRVRKVLGIKAHHPYPRAALESVYIHLKRINNFSIEETAGLISVAEDGFEPYRRFFDERNGSRSLPFTQGSIVDVKAFVRSILPGDLANLPRTGLSAKGGKMPPPRVLDRFSRFGPLRQGAILFALLKAPSCNTDSPLQTVTPALDRIDQLLLSQGPELGIDAGRFTEILREYLAGDIGCDLLDRRCPYEMVDAYLMVENFLTKLLKTFPHDLRLRLEAICPPRTMFHPEELAMIREKCSENAAGFRNNRKQAVAPVKDYLSDLVEVAENRRNQVRYIANKIRSAFTNMAGSEEFKDIVLRIDPLDEKGFQTTITSTLKLRVWRAGPLSSSILKDLEKLSPAEKSKLDRLRTYRETEAKMGTSSYPLVELLDYDDAAKLPWCLNIMIARAAAYPSTLPLHVRKHRLEIIEQMGFPGFRPVRAGFLKFAGGNEVVSKYATHVNRCVIPIFEFERAIRYGALLFEGSVQTSRRLHEILQLDTTVLERTEDGKNFEAMVVQKRPAMSSISHPGMVDLTLNDKTVVEAMDLDDLQKAQFGWEELPTIKPPSILADKVAPGRFCFSWNGKAIGHSTMCLTLRYLFSGWPSVTTHLVRHAESEESGEDGIPVSIVGAGLGQVEPLMTEYYMGLDLERMHFIRESNDVRRLNEIESRAGTWPGEDDDDD